MKIKPEWVMMAWFEIAGPEWKFAVAASNCRLIISEMNVMAAAI